jgi:perosamine synthetase
MQLIIYRLFIYPRTTALAQNLFRHLTKKGAVVGSSSTSEFEPVKADDFFKGISKMQARSGIRQLDRIEENIAHRQKMAQLYDELLAAKGLKSSNDSRDWVKLVLVRYPVRIKEKYKALAQAAKAGIELGSWFESVLHPIETPLDSYDYKLGMCLDSEKAARETVNLPLHPRTNEKTAVKTVKFITGFIHS